MILKRVQQTLASLKLTVFLFFVSIILLFFGTLAQVDNDIYFILNEYFRSFFVFIDFQTLLPRSIKINGAFLFLGGLSIGTLLLINLLAMLPLHFKVNANRKEKLFGSFIFTLAIILFIFLSHSQLSNYLDTNLENPIWRVLKKLLNAGGVSLLFLWASYIFFKSKGSLFIVHLSILFLIIFELITYLFAEEGTITMLNGETVSFVDLSNKYELVIIDETPKNFNTVIKIPTELLKENKTITIPEYNFSLTPLKYFKNSLIKNLKRTPLVTKGLGLQFNIGKAQNARGVSLSNNTNIPSFIIKIEENGEEIGNFLTSLWFYPNTNQRKIKEKQYFSSKKGKIYRLELRNKREYLKNTLGVPYSFTLEEFRNKKYIGTNKTRDFSSVIWINDGKSKEKINIWMNNPLRYEQKTFYQAAYLPEDKGSILQVVKNPAWFIPYFVFMTILISLCSHFFIHLKKYLIKRNEK